jgi:hypothetical protein
VLLSHLDFAKDSLWVRYRASAEPQRLDIDIRTAGPVPVEFGRVYLRRVLDIVNFGAAGGSLFDPLLSSARLLSGPPEGAALGPDYRWSIKIAGVAPVALRTFVEQLRSSGGLLQPVTSMALQGSLPPDGGLLSATEDDVRAWLRDPDAYVDVWPAPGFPVLPRAIESGATLRIALADEITPPIAEALRTLAVAWVNVTSEYVAEWGQLAVISPAWKFLPSFGMGRRELSARYHEFPRRRAPSRAAIVNMLARFHRTIAPIVEAEVGL